MRTWLRLALRRACAIAASSRSTARDLARAAEHLGAEREAARVAAQVEDARAVREAGDRPAVLPLVAEEAGLVPLLEVHLVADAVLADLHRPRRRGVGLVEGRRLDPLQASQVVVDLDPGEAGAGQLVEERQPARQPLGDPEAEELAEEDLPVAVDRQPAQAVAVGVDQAVGVRRLVQAEDVPGAARRPGGSRPRSSPRPPARSSG